MRVTRRPAIAIFILLGICLVGLIVTLNVTWIILNWRRLLLLWLGIPVFLLVIAGVVVNTVFLVREVRRNERQNNFLNTVTHELKTPIASIRLYVETLQRHTLSDEKRQEFYAIILADSERLLSTVEQVLKAGEVTQRTGKHATEPIDLMMLTRAAIAATVTRHHLAPEAIVYEPGREPSLMITGNPEDLETALLNILSNAVKYSPNGVRATVQTAVRGNWVTLEVSDHGIGIPRAHLKSVFKRFYRVPTRMVLRTKGTGLGLFLVRSIARQHGGDARAQSSGEGLGTTITMELPRGRSRPSRSRSNLAVARILIVEDEAHLAEGLLFNLQAEGYEAELARDGEAALTRLLPMGESFDRGGSAAGADEGLRALGPLSAEEPGLRDPGAASFTEGSRSQMQMPARIDAVLLDVMLPGKSGFDVVGELRAASIYVPILMLTARGRPEDVLHGLEAGADDYLAKPFDLSMLLARLKVLLRRVRWYKIDGDLPLSTGSEEENQPATYSFAGRTIDFSLLELTAKGMVIRLTLMEADFLRYLSRHPSRIIPRKELLEQVWRVHEDTDTRAIDNFVVRLRRYLEDEPANPVYLKTVRGVGYRFLPNGE